MARKQDVDSLLPAQGHFIEGILNVSLIAKGMMSVAVIKDMATKAFQIRGHLSLTDRTAGLTTRFVSSVCGLLVGGATLILEELLLDVAHGRPRLRLRGLERDRDRGCVAATSCSTSRVSEVGIDGSCSRTPGAVCRCGLGR